MMRYVIDTVLDIQRIMLAMGGGSGPGEGVLQPLRFANVDLLVINVTEKKSGDVVTLEVQNAPDKE
jgi:hypothetical protein